MINSIQPIERNDNNFAAPVENSGIPVAQEAIKASSSVPPSSQQSKLNRKIVVVGAGFAGLTTAYRLHQQGYDVELYEARNRPGGRVHTAHFGDSYEEYGGKNLMDGGDPDNIFPLVQEMGLNLIWQRRNWSLSAVWNNVLYNDKELFKNAPELTKEALEKLKEKAASAQNLAQVIDEFLSEHPRLCQVMHMCLENYEGSPTDKLSPSYVEEEFPFIYGFFRSMSQEDVSPEFEHPFASIEGGNDCLAQALADKLEGHIHYSSPLTALHQTPDEKLELTFDKANTVADYVVLTLPCTTLRDVDIQKGLFPEDQWKAIQTQQYGTNAKLLIPIKTKDPIYPATCITPNLFTWTNLDASVMTWYFGGPAGNFEDRTEKGVEDVLARDLEAVRKVYPTVEFDEKKIIGKSWVHDPYAKGSYSNYWGDQFAFFDERIVDCGEPVRKVYRPIKGRIFFAGEHTSVTAASTMEGAVESGERTARLVQNYLKI